MFSTKIMLCHSKSLKRAGKINLIRFDNEDKIGLLNYIDYPSEKIIENYLSSLRMETTYRRLSRLYGRIDNLHQKLDLSLVSTLNYFSSGLVYAFYLSNRLKQDERLTIINCELGSFISHEYKIFDKRCIHILFPLGQFVNIFSEYIKTRWYKILRNKKKNQEQRIDRSILHNKNTNLAILFHKSDQYGRLFRKSITFPLKKTVRFIGTESRNARSIPTRKRLLTCCPLKKYATKQII